jgi:hypothetical protein
MVTQLMQSSQPLNGDDDYYYDDDDDNNNNNKSLVSTARSAPQESVLSNTSRVMAQNCNPLLIAKRSITEYAGSREVNFEDILQD